MSEEKEQLQTAQIQAIQSRIETLVEQHKQGMEQRAAIQNNLNARTQALVMLGGQIQEAQYWLDQAQQAASAQNAASE